MWDMAGRETGILSHTWQHGAEGGKEGCNQIGRENLPFLLPPPTGSLIGIQPGSSPDKQIKTNRKQSIVVRLYEAAVAQRQG